ncbi:MAG: nitroreductase family protein [Candidatus Ratteibacteria bacterium]|jgi:nitroreductase
MNGLELIKKRRSVRSYRPEPVSKDLVEKIVDAGRLAATAINIQPWEFIVIIDPDKRRELADITDHGKFIKDAGVCIAVVVKDTKYYLEDGAAATENILLAATELGFGSCWVAGDKKEYAEKILIFLGVPSGYKLVSLVAVGYPQGNSPNPAKRPLSEVLHWEKFRRL